ncbi:MAG: 6-carboxytetrahydropterin synthase QueD [Oscillospiraceae bacterium]
MYFLKTEAAFDSAHFLFGYEGKCSNIHGHRWKIEIEIRSEKLCADGQLKGMIVDFGDLKADLKALADSFDHTFIYEKGSLKPSTVEALKSEGFRLTEVDFRPTAENFSQYFYGCMKAKGYDVYRMTVYETPNNCAVYTED